jgi:hypothetical protein
MTSEDKLQLQQSGIIAIPIKQTEDLKPSPNFLIFHNQFGKLKSPFQDLQTGEITNTDCIQTVYSVVNREFLEPNEFHPTRMMIERSLLPAENLPIPVDLLPLFFTYERIKANIDLVNLALSKFTFRGSLSTLVLEVDEVILNEFIAVEPEPVPVIEEPIIEEPVIVTEPEPVINS